MISVIYKVTIYFYYAVIWMAQFFNSKAKKWIDGRKKIWNTLPNTDGKKVVWFHCASLGEFDQGLPLINQLKKQKPELFVVVTFFSPSGMEHYHKRNAPIDYACYLPIDTKRNAYKFIQLIKPSVCYFVKYEFWHYFIEAAHKNQIPIYSICTIFRKEHRFFRWYGDFFRKTLRLISHFFVQTQESIELLKSIKITNATLVGDMRFDRVIENKQNVYPDQIVEEFLVGEKAFIVGSSWSVDEDFLQNFVKQYIQKGKVIIAPHDIKENHLLEIEKRFAPNIIRYSNFTILDPSHSILLIDSIGKLANLYQYGYFAYIGGGFTGNLHNILEPAVFGLPVIFGPKHQRFPEAQLFINEGVGFAAATIEKLQICVKDVEQNLNTIKSTLEKVIESQKGVTEKILILVNN